MTYDYEREARSLVLALLDRCPSEDSIHVLEWRASGMSWTAIASDLAIRLWRLEQ